MSKNSDSVETPGQPQFGNGLTENTVKTCDKPDLKMNGHVTAEAVNGLPATPEIPTIAQLRKYAGDYTVSDRPLGYIKPVRIITIGAGASGINMAYQVKNYLKEAELVVYDKNPGLGGTWFENRYPGCKCDIRKSHPRLQYLISSRLRINSIA